MIEVALSIAAGLGLSAACGFRIFLPFTVMSIAAMTGYLDLSDGFAWVGSIPALVLFATATLVEVGAYYIPWLDNVLDTIATPTAVIAGAVAAVAVMTDMPPAVVWTVAAIAGGTAGSVQSGSVLSRALSTATTGGLGNFLVSSAELGSAVLMSILAILFPALALVLVVLLVTWIISRLTRRTRTSAAS